MHSRRAVNPREGQRLSQGLRVRGCSESDTVSDLSPAPAGPTRAASVAVVGASHKSTAARETLGVGDCVCVGLDDCVRVADNSGLDVSVWLGLCACEFVCVSDTPGGSDCDGLWVVERDCICELLCDAACDGVAVLVHVWVRLEDPDPDKLGDCDTVLSWVCDCERDGDTVRVPVWLLVPLGVAVADAD